LRATAHSEQLETVLDVLSHDLRNPLNIIDGHLELLTADLNDDETIETIRQAVARITEIIGATLTSAESGALSELEALSVDDLARTAWTTVPVAEATLVVEGAPRVIGDRRLLVQPFENLCRNAVEHAGADATVRLGVLDTGFCVEDDGLGIPESVRENAVRTDYSTRRTGGLGLALVQAVVRAHGGDLTITEAVGGGARFELTGFERPPEPTGT